MSVSTRGILGTGRGGPDNQDEHHQHRRGGCGTSYEGHVSLLAWCSPSHPWATSAGAHPPRSNQGHKVRSLTTLWVDEISFCKGHNYVITVTDLLSGQIVWAAEGKNALVSRLG
jgi:hypothetical protein